MVVVLDSGCQALPVGPRSGESLQADGHRHGVGQSLREVLYRVGVRSDVSVSDARSFEAVDGGYDAEILMRFNFACFARVSCRRRSADQKRV